MTQPSTPSRPVPPVETITDPDLNARLAAAIDLIFTKIAPGLADERPTQAGGTAKVAAFNATGSPHRWELFTGTAADGHVEGRRANYTRTTDWLSASLWPDAGGQAVTVQDSLRDRTPEEHVADLERLAALTDPAIWGRA